MRYMVVVEKGSSSYGAFVPDLPGCIAVGETEAEAPAFKTELKARLLTVCFMRCAAISCMFWLCYMMLAIRAVGQKAANE